MLSARPSCGETPSRLALLPEAPFCSRPASRCRASIARLSEILRERPGPRRRSLRARSHPWPSEPGMSSRTGRFPRHSLAASAAASAPGQGKGACKGRRPQGCAFADVSQAIGFCQVLRSGYVRAVWRACVAAQVLEQPTAFACARIHLQVGGPRQAGCLEVPFHWAHPAQHPSGIGQVGLAVETRRGQR